MNHAAWISLLLSLAFIALLAYAAGKGWPNPLQHFFPFARKPGRRVAVAVFCSVGVLGLLLLVCVLYQAVYPERWQESMDNLYRGARALWPAGNGGR